VSPCVPRKCSREGHAVSSIAKVPRAEEAFGRIDVRVRERKGIGVTLQPLFR
jgi:hypothetical protein